MTLITIASNKGGAGKSTTAATLAYALAADASTLLIDLDPQGHAAIVLGCEPRAGVFEWLVNGNFAPTQPRPQHPRLQLLPGDTRTKTVDLLYRAEVDGAKQLLTHLRSRQQQFRWVVIDTAASGLLQETAIAAADVVVVPYRPELLGVDGVYGALALIERLNQAAHALVVPVAYAKRLQEQRTNVTEVAALATSTLTVALPIPARSAVEKAMKAGLTIWEHKAPALTDVKRGYQWVIQTLHSLTKEQHHGTP